MIQVTAICRKADGNQTSKGGLFLLLIRESDKSVIGNEVGNSCLLDEIMGGLQNFILLSGAIWKVGAFEKALKDMGMQVSLVEAFKGAERPELKSTDTKAIVDKKFDEQLGDYVDWLNGLNEVGAQREIKRGGSVRTFSAMDVNSVLNDELLFNKQPWQDDADKSDFPEAEYARQVTNMFRSQARKISGLSDLELTSQSIPMSLDLNVVERFGVYKLQKNAAGKYETKAISPKVYVKNKGFVKFSAWFNESGDLWKKYMGDGWEFNKVADYFREFDKTKAGRDLGDLPYGIAWEYFLSLLKVDITLGVDFEKTLEIPKNFGTGNSCIKFMADGYHQYGVEQAIKALKNSVGHEPSSEIVIWNYPKSD